MLPTKLVDSTIRKKNLHKHAHPMATGQTGRNCAQMHCTTASGTLTSEHKKKREKKRNIPVAFRRSTKMQTGGPEDVAWAEAFTQVVRYCAENNKQITITNLCEKLKRHFGEDVILTGIRGKRNVVTSRSTAEKILERFLKSAS